MYRSLLLEEARVRLSHGFRPFVGMLTILGGGAFLAVQEVDSGNTDAEKDEFVMSIRHRAQAQQAIAVWFGARGWTAPDWKPRPSKHPKGKRVLMLFESTVLGDRLWEAYLRQERKDEDGVYCDDIGRWYDFGNPGTGRFVNLIGKGPRLVSHC